jgi:hypothetical protein
MNTEGSGFDPTAVERVFATELTAEERAELGAVCMRHGVTPDHPVLLAVAEQLIFRRRLDERLSRFEAIAQRVEAAASCVVIYRERPQTRRYGWQWSTVLALVAIVGLGAWFLGGAVAAAHLRLASARISSALATPAGAAAMHLLEVKGAGRSSSLAVSTSRFRAAALQTAQFGTRARRPLHTQRPGRGSRRPQPRRLPGR